MSWVPARIGDEVIEEIGLDKIAMIKVDVEGAEFEVLSGLSSTLKRFRPAVLFELWPNYLEDGTLMDQESRDFKSARANMIYSLFDEIDYTVHQIDGQGNEIRSGVLS